MIDIKFLPRGVIADFTVVDSLHMEEQDGYKTVKKTWRERLTWRFWESTKEVPNMVPMKSVILDKQNRILFCHPAVRKELEGYINEA